MKKYELLPTEENILDTLYQDTINRNKDIVYFYNVLQAQESASTIALDGRWGSGKTFFVKQIQMVINALNPSNNMEQEKKMKTIAKLPFPQKEDGENENFSIAVYYDAWENDNETDPVVSILYEIAKQMSIEFSLSNKNVFKIAGAVIEAISGHNINGIVDALSSEEPLAKFKAQKDIQDNIKKFFCELLNERGNRLIIIIDELDRCKPSFAVQLLEQIKHYLCDDRITYVFSVNLDQLQHTVKHYYGNDFDSCRYLDRFFDLRIALPPANMDKFYEQIGLDFSDWMDTVIKQIIRMFNFELREISRFYLQVKTAIYKPLSERKRDDFIFSDGKGKRLILIYIVPLMIGLKIADISRYNDFVNGKDGKTLKSLFSLLDEENRVLSCLLNKDESFGNEEGKTLVTPEEIVDKLYDAIFVNQYSGRKYNTVMGEYEFSASSKNFALSVSNMMSNYADLT